ncbi:hypothetical protein A3E66_03755 [Candidatus Daviesbacteria bacterium RIFCSPHIGHO2_12_FULL_37_16]|uniref:Uncharacterized protein n=1 Tax=Candidatus Daviesbacteria bacterium RIFCSPHIGHO2_12_FULL_37_16 TaxID=1797778 RepID=A0A1F5K175_9BACT|nr:MAG: hypothetical protein A3C99_01625 [Candidatus Daviesbacteria bacterium RIFCSPHIGHO2_02_FULL_37_9]OGE34717.1 MAG: hypothetical protein A3E66_03755 [Candidatus Daviesbacteria bacterium RIFCSPHIGHO2_12_FULL_37_16]
MDEKRLQILRQQLSQKSMSLSSKKTKEVEMREISTPVAATTAALKIEDTNYLYKDLRKIIILSVLALALQGILYYSLQMNLIRLWF